MIARLATALVLVAACSRAPSREPTGDRDRPIANRRGTVAVDAGPDADADATCVADCVQGRLMVATSMGAIRADSVRRCSQPMPGLR